MRRGGGAKMTSTTRNYGEFPVWLTFHNIQDGEREEGRKRRGNVRSEGGKGQEVNQIYQVWIFFS